MSEFARICWCAVALCGLVVSAAQAEDLVDSPEYKHWSQFKPGSQSVFKTVSTMMGQKSESTMTTTLKELTAEYAIVEIEIVATIAGKNHTMPKQKRKVPAKVSKEEAKKQLEPEGKIKEGKEDLEVAGKKIKTKWIEMVTKHGDSTMESKIWTSDEVPGQVVKTLTKMKGPTTTTSEGILVKFKAEKK
ncbi:MAG: hypothetical protein JXQ75_07375 [Phycisphaerae bacterium]|nr:hypothetical protein [Phycisphaerae bacterium]